MADNKKISELAVATTPTGAEILEIVQGGVNKQTTLQAIADLAGDEHFKGVYVSEAALNIAVPSAVAGDYAFVDAGAASPVELWIWDTDDSEWVQSGSGGVATWGAIAGTLSSQTDLNTALLARLLLVNSVTGLTDAASIDLTAIKHTLTTSSSRTFTISYTGDDITIEVTLSATSATQTFPAGSLCVTDGAETGDNTCPMSGVSGDKYIIAIKKIGSVYYVVCKNFGQ